MPEQFISEPIEMAYRSQDTGPMARGRPGTPERFFWRGDEYRVAEVLEMWDQTGPGLGGGSRYLRKHWYRIRTTDGDEMKLYFERKARSNREIIRRWWLYSRNTV